MNKCVMTFVFGMAVSLASYAFFQNFMQMPQQAFQMGSQMMMPQPCDCQCEPK